MKRVFAWTVRAATVAAALSWNAVARAQTAPTTPGTPGLGQYASDNVSGGSIRARSPGNMVGAGVARAQEAADFARGGIEIVETSGPPSPRATFLVDAIEIVFEQLNRTLLLLGNVLLQRAGLPPLIPESVPLPPAENIQSKTVDPGDVNANQVRDFVGDR